MSLGETPPVGQPVAVAPLHLAKGVVDANLALSAVAILQFPHSNPLQIPLNSLPLLDGPLPLDFRPIGSAQAVVHYTATQLVELQFKSLNGVSVGLEAEVKVEVIGAGRGGPGEG
jgi:hypothetical protein